MKRRIVITGLGSVNPLGTSVPASWQRLLEGHSGVRNLLESVTHQHLHSTLHKLSCHHGAPVIEGETESKGLNERMKWPKSVDFAIKSANEALKDARIKINPEKKRDDIGVVFGCGMTALQEIAESSVLLENQVFKLRTKVPLLLLMFFRLTRDFHRISFLQS